jgi:hypothetical protein
MIGGRMKKQPSAPAMKILRQHGSSFGALMTSPGGATVRLTAALNIDDSPATLQN